MLLVRHRSVAIRVWLGTSTDSIRRRFSGRTVSTTDRGRMKPATAPLGEDIQTPQPERRSIRGDSCPVWGSAPRSIGVHAPLRKLAQCGQRKSNGPKKATIWDVHTGPRVQPCAFILWMRRKARVSCPRPRGTPPMEHQCTVLMQAAWAIVSTAPRSGRETGCAASRSLRAVHRWQRRCAKRPDNVPPPRRPGTREGAGGIRQLQADAGLG